MAALCRLLNRNQNKLKNGILSLSNIRTNYAHRSYVIPAIHKFPNNSISVPQIASSRLSHTFFNRVTADQLWKGVTSVSNAGRKKGRGKRSGRRIVQDLNRGQVIGFGKKSMLWPGLNAPVVRGREVMKQQELPYDDTREKRIIEMRDSRVSSGRRLRLTPLERGFSGTKLPGRTIGPPDPVGEETFEGFDSRVLQHRIVMTMSGKFGRVRRFNSLVVVGNRKGLAGFGVHSSPTGMTAAHNAKNKAAQRLRYIERYKEHTVLHDFHTSYGAVNIFVKKKPKGFGLVCHRAIREICKMVGITDIYCKVEGGAQNYQNVTKAFFIGLMNQKTPQQLADEKGLHLIEYRRERHNFPEIIASPQRCRTNEEIDIDEIIHFNLYVHQGRVPEFRPTHQPFYWSFPSYKKKLKDIERFRNHKKVLIEMIARYGEKTSFLHLQEAEKDKQELLNAADSKE